MNHVHEARFCACGTKVSECRCVGEKPHRVTRQRCIACTVTVICDWPTNKFQQPLPLQRPFFDLELMRSPDVEVAWVRDHSSVIDFCNSAAIEMDRREQLER